LISSSRFIFDVGGTSVLARGVNPDIVSSFAGSTGVLHHCGAAATAPV
jgi:hypothetical protein